MGGDIYIPFCKLGSDAENIAVSDGASRSLESTDGLCQGKYQPTGRSTETLTLDVKSTAARFLFICLCMLQTTGNNYLWLLLLLLLWFFSANVVKSA